MSTLVFGRTEYAEPLVQLGKTDDEDVRHAFPGEWVELVTEDGERHVRGVVVPANARSSTHVDLRDDP